MLGATPGAHRWIWDLRRPRPKAVAYNYSIAAVWGLNTPLDPRGQFVEPGRYTAVLTVDGRQQTATFDVLPDPRVTGADYRAARAFSESLYDPMEKAWRGYAETKAVRDALDKRIGEIRDPALLAQAKALRTKLEPPTAPNAGFEGESGTLGLLETSAEGSDSAPRWPAPDRRPNRRRSEPRLGRVATDEGRGARAAQSPPCRRSPAADRRSCRSGAPRRSSRGRRRASLSEPPASLGDRLLRVILTAAYKLYRLNWLVRRPRTFGAHAFALTPERKLILVKLRYAPGWRLPGGGRDCGEDPRDAALRELREEIGMTSHGDVRPAAELEQQPDYRRDLVSLLVVEDVRYTPRWSWEVEQVIEAPLDGLPTDLAPVARAWVDAILRPTDRA